MNNAEITALLGNKDVVALVHRAWFRPIEGRGRSIAPPTFAAPQGEDGSRYAIDTAVDGKKVAVIDTVGAQANRLEPLFKEPPLDALLAQVSIRAKDGVERSLLDLGHRIADAMIRFSTIAPDVDAALTALRSGDATALAKLAPTSMLFGAWDSRGSQDKLPRLLRATMEADNIAQRTSRAQYRASARYVDEGLLDGSGVEADQKLRSAMGFEDAPAAGLGGVQVHGDIRRDASFNLIGLRGYRAGKDPLATEKLQRYLFGLGLVAFTAPFPGYLRQGCFLVEDNEREGGASQWRAVKRDGTELIASITYDEALAYATEAAKVFGVGANKAATFEVERVKTALEERSDSKAKKAKSKGKT